jgi:hypothetical protein
MNERLRAPAILSCGLFLILAAAPAAPGTMYLRLPNDRSASAVTKLSYDAIATVPKRASTPASLLPPDRVEASLIVPATTGGHFESFTRRNYPLWTVVETDGAGNVTRRTMFHAVTISSIRPMQPGDGQSACVRVRFSAASVISEPGKVAVAN